MRMNNSRWLRPFLVTLALLIFVVSLLVSNFLVTALEAHVRDLEAHVKGMETHVKGLEGLVVERRQEELDKMKLWVEAMRTINNADENTDLSLAISVLESNNTIPMVVFDSCGNVNNYRNIELQAGCDTAALVNEVVEHARARGYVIRMDMAPYGGFMSVLYEESLELSRLSRILDAQSVLLESQSRLLDSQSQLLARLSYYP